MTELATQTMQTAAREIGVALADARTALETHVEQPANAALLERCAFELHQVQGALRVLEIYGAALLAEEMEQVSRYLISSRDERKNQSESLDALMRAMVQLPGYLERVLAGGRDLALVLLPLLNDLRAVRGCSLLSEGTLLLLNLKSDRQAQPTSPAPGEAPLSPAQWARRLRSRFQAGLVGWIRGERLEQNLEILATVATRLEQVATQQCVFQLWWVVGALLEALREHGVESSVTIKRLLGLADREIKRLYEIGEARYAQTPPIELLNNLLYYVARSTTAGPRVAAVRASFRLNELLPVDEGIEQERENLSAPSVKLMHTVAAAIREDLTRVKDVLDIFVRRGGGQVEELAPQIELLRKIGDTLGVLGLGELRGRVQEANTRLEGVVAGRESADEATLVQVAATLIQVEDHLDGQLVGLILPKAPRPEGEPLDQDFEQVQGAVLRECVVNLARVKESIAQNVSGTLDAAGFDSWLELMRGIKAGLLMLGKGRAVEVVDAITAQLRRIMQPGGLALSGAYLDRLADAVVSLEYYIETLQAGRSDPWYMLDNAQACLEVLGREPEQEVPTVSPVGAGSFARTVRISPPAETLPGAALDPDSTGRVRTPPVLAAAPTAGANAAVADPEMLSLFAEEAREELEKIREQYPVWDQNPLEATALATVCRSFHTLKGSGRMVGARELSEFAWAMENLVNRLIDGTLARSHDILATLRAAVDLLPKLVDEIGAGPANRSSATELVARAHALAAGRDAAVQPEAAAEPAVEPAPAARAMGGAAQEWAATELLTPAETAAIVASAVPARQGAPAQPVAAAAAAADGAAARSCGGCCRGRGCRQCGERRGTARDLRARDRHARGHGAPVADPRAAAPCAARTDRRGVSRLPYALGQLEDGRGAPRHPPVRAAQPLAAQVLRQRRGARRFRPAAAVRLHARHGRGRHASGREHGLFRRARHAARAHRARRARSRPARGRGERAERALGRALDRTAPGPAAGRACAAVRHEHARARLRSGSRRDILRGGERAARVGADRAAGVERHAGVRRAPGGAQARAAHLQGRGAHGRHRRDGRSVA
jgi:chemosensory pili system protein ChpA (sensor histidine kinase/response regulator)